MANPSAFPPQVLEALRRGNKIEAIKLLREATKVGLAEAKGVVDALEAHGRAQAGGQTAASPSIKHMPHVARRPREDDLGPGEEPRHSLTPVMMAIALAAAAFAAWWFLKS